MTTFRRITRSLWVVAALPLAGCPDSGRDTAAGESQGTGIITATGSSTGDATPTSSTGGTPTTTEVSTLGSDSSGATGGTTGGTTGDTTGAQQTTGIDTGDGVLDISPKDVVLEIVDGNIVMQPFTATYDGADVTAEVVWLYDKPEIGEMMLGAVFVPTGKVAGPGQLQASYKALKAGTGVAVKIVKTLDPGALGGGFGDPAGPDPTLKIVYPYDGTVFPLKVAAPVVQWNGAQNGDQYKLHLKEEYYEYTIYFTADNPTRHLIDAVEWIGLSESGQGAKNDPITFELQRKSGATTYQPVTQTWRMAQARLPGRIYYWELPANCGNGNGRVLSVKPTEAMATEFYQPNTCWGCHSVSRDGRTVSASFNFPLATIDVSKEPAVQGAIPPNQALTGTFSAWNQDSTRILLSKNYAVAASASPIVVVDAMNGGILNPDLMGVGCGEPAWSPDGSKIAATCGYNSGSWTFDDGNADLVIADVKPDGITVSNKHILVPRLGEVGRPAYPNFSPGNEWVVFGRPTQGSRSTGNGKLWMVGVDGQNLVRLDIASSDDKSFNPTFAPIRAGGYFWVVFMSRRDYGNTLVGANRQQLWITAISDPPTGGDPSNPPFYVRGQEDCALSENAYFASDPCIEEPNKACESGIDCCSGHCIQMGEVKSCGEKELCAEAGNACETDADCCDPESPCVDGYCQQIFPG